MSGNLAETIPPSTRTRRAPRAAAATGAGKPSPKRSRRPAAQPARVPLAQIIPSNVEAPKTTTKVKPPLSELAALLEVCKGSDFISRRDTAIIRVLIDNGMRVSGPAGLRYVPDDPERNDVWLSKHMLRIVLKGGNEHLAPIGKRAAAALDRYLRSRATHSAARERQGPTQCQPASPYWRYSTTPRHSCRCSGRARTRRAVIAMVSRSSKSLMASRPSHVLE
ncbi:hypothetical protein AB0G06_13855 [Nonomuraea dietziae]|uniref:hypothetical protein n=1 Tax=Nonomuraea dietziae TaxID=65515 RepID=UPI003402AAB0